MAHTVDPYHHHPELKGKIVDPLTSFYRTLQVDDLLKQNPDMAWIKPFLHTDDFRAQSCAEILKARRDKDLWIFAYGSLMWDPALDFAEVRRANLPNYSRKFVLKEIFGGRGTVEAPGLVAALDAGGECEGMAFRILREKIEDETHILWRREMFAPGYIPKFLTANMGGVSTDVLTFVADHSADSICSDITRSMQVNYLATAGGILGTSRDYLANVVQQIDVLELRDDDCRALLEDVDRQIAQANA